MLWFVIALAVVAVILMIKGGGWYFREDTSAEYAATKRKGLYFIVVGAGLIMSLAFWNEFIYKKSSSALEREQKRITTLCTDVVKAYNKSKEAVEFSRDDMKLIQFPFLPKASSKALGNCTFSIVATVDATHRKGGTEPKTYEATVQADPIAKTWSVLEVRWLD